MASIRQLKSRIRSVTNTKQITRAMEMVAASKMRRAQESSKASGPYANAASQLLTYLASQNVTDGHPYFEKRKVERRMFIVVASDKGLAGAYNSNILREYAKQLNEDEKMDISNTTITVGRRATRFASRLKDVELSGAY